MKIAPLLLASATALETASTAHNLLSAVGHRNATKMEALVQGLVEESISEPGWKFDEDIVGALNAIRNMFVKNIQSALNDAHKVNQEQINCFTKDCFGDCVDDYQKKITDESVPGFCNGYNECLGEEHEHEACRDGYWTLSSDDEMGLWNTVYTRVYGTTPTENISHTIVPLDGGEKYAYLYDLDHRTPKQYRLHHGELEEWTSVKHKYIRMAQDCSALHSFIHRWTEDECTPESCLCPELSNCHRKGIAPQGSAYVDETEDEVCHPQAGDCNSGYGAWLQRMTAKYSKGYDEWSLLHKECKLSYHAFLTEDLKCDEKQKKFETCMCAWRACHHTACHIDYQQCHDDCWSKYEDHVFETECLEKDRKIDWSATKKIECYVDILLHEYTKEELVTKCGDENCINKAREEDYKHCHTICLEVDHSGEWPPFTLLPGKSLPDEFHGYAARVHESQYLLGDNPLAPTLAFECDSNGPEVVFTRHRGGSSREEEERCTEHLDIDYQVPACITCEQPVPPVCDEAFHKEHYLHFDNADKIECINDPFDHNCNDDDHEKTCFEDVTIKSSSDGHKFEWITVSEHSKAWAYNRCPCTDCITGYPQYPPVNLVCGQGAHTLVRSVASGDSGDY